MIRMICPHCHHAIEVGDLVITCRCSNCNQIVHVQEDDSIIKKSKIASAIEFLEAHPGIIMFGIPAILMIGISLAMILHPIYLKWLESLTF